MTTRVAIACPDNSHWSLEIVTQDKVYDHAEEKMTDEWRKVGSITIRPGGKHETYIHDSRRLLIQEVEA